MSPFVIGEEYERSRLLEFLGSGQTQSGVLWGRESKGVLFVHQEAEAVRKLVTRMSESLMVLGGILAKGVQVINL